MDSAVATRNAATMLDVRALLVPVTNGPLNWLGVLDVILQSRYSDWEPQSRFPSPSYAPVKLRLGRTPGSNIYAYSDGLCFMEMQNGSKTIRPFDVENEPFQLFEPFQWLIHPQRNNIGTGFVAPLIRLCFLQWAIEQGNDTPFVASPPGDLRPSLSRIKDFSGYPRYFWDSPVQFANILYQAPLGAHACIALGGVSISPASDIFPSYSDYVNPSHPDRKRGGVIHRLDVSNESDTPTSPILSHAEEEPHTILSPMSLTEEDLVSCAQPEEAQLSTAIIADSENQPVEHRDDGSNGHWSPKPAVLGARAEGTSSQEIDDLKIAVNHMQVSRNVEKERRCFYRRKDQ
jgi:hypothetical protein